MKTEFSELSGPYHKEQALKHIFCATIDSFQEFEDAIEEFKKSNFRVFEFEIILENISYFIMRLQAIFRWNILRTKGKSNNILRLDLDEIF